MTRSRGALRALALGTLALGATLEPAHAGSPAQPILDKARSLYQAGDYKGAEAAYREATAKDPGLAAAWRELGHALHAQGQDAEALRIWDNLLRLDPSDRATLNVAGEVSLSRDAFQRAVDLLQRSLRVDPTQTNIKVRLGEAFEGTGAWDKAAQQYDEVLKAEPGRVDVVLHRARVDERQDRIQPAIARLEAAVKRDASASEKVASSLARLYATVGDGAYRETDYGAARAAFEAGLRWDPANPHLLTALGWTHRKAGDTAAALAAWTKALAQPEAVTANLLRAVAEARMEQGELDEARRLLERARPLAPEEPSPCLQLAEIGFRKEDAALREASLRSLLAIPKLDLEWVDRASELFLHFEKPQEGVAFFGALPASAPARGRGLGRLYASQSAAAYKAGRPEEAIRLGKLALDNDPRNHQALRDLGWIQARQGDWEGAAATWKRFVAAYPELPESHDLLAQALLSRRDYKGAITEEHLALARDPNQRVARLRLLRALSLDGRTVEARDLAGKLAKEMPDDLPVQYRHAEILTRLGEHRAAREAWAQVRRLDPDKLRPIQNWIRETYSLEEYEAATAEARKLAEAKPAPESSLVFLVQDAELREEPAEALPWLRRLTDEYPANSGYWLHLCRVLREQQRYEEALAAAAEGVRRAPANVDLKINEAEVLLEAGRSRQALERFTRLAAENPGNAPAFRGMVYALLETRHFREALDHLRSGFHETFFSSYEADLWRASALSGLGRPAPARETLARLVAPEDGTRHVPVLLYHGILGQKLSAAITPAKLDEQLAAVERAGFTAITITEMVRMVAGKEPWPKKPILITFDDARTDSFAEADPILARHHQKATMFVPTGDSAPTADLFHASWKTMARIKATGRWDLQGHGFEAHDALPIDAEGHTGRFLSDRAWLPDLQRKETDAEFRNRLDYDYKQCRALLTEHFPDVEPVAFAFPFNEAGQLNVTEVDEATAVNEETWRRYFRFGMVQDGSGYNAVRPGETGPRLLWRFEPQRNWGGAEVLQHLARHNPQNAARVQLARLELWQGYPVRARRRLEELEREVPEMRPECEMALAEVAWADTRPREAGRHLDEALATAPAKLREEPLLARRLRWENEPHLGLGADALQGSDHRDRTRSYLTFHGPFKAPVDLDFRVGSVRYSERKLGDVSGQELEGRLAWAPNPYFAASGWGRRARLDGITRGAAFRNSAGLDLRFAYEIHELQLEGTRDDMDTVAAFKAGVRQTVAGAGYTLRQGHWDFHAGATQARITDHNRIDTASARLLYRPGSMEEWQFGVQGEQADSSFHSGLYYTPMDYRSAKLVARWQHGFREGSSLGFDASGGRSDDAVNHTRWTGTAALAWVKLWGPHFRSTLNLGSGSTTGYTSRQGSLILDWRF